MDVNLIAFSFSIIVLILSVVVHELSHGMAADMLGDPTPRMQGRLTLNPFKHLDPVGSFLLPVLTYNLGGFIFGWAKPVEFNPHNLNRSRFVARWGEGIIAIAGPLSNIIIAGAFATLIRFSPVLGVGNEVLELSLMIVIINISLAVFNLLPIPPLDGSKILFALLPQHLQEFRYRFEQMGFILIIGVILVGGKIILPLIRSITAFLIGS